MCKLKFIEKLDSVIARFILRYILKFSISNPMNYEFGSSMSLAKTMQKIEYFKVLPCFLFVSVRIKIQNVRQFKFPRSEADVKFELR